MATLASIAPVHEDSTPQKETSVTGVMDQESSVATLANIAPVHRGLKRLLPKECSVIGVMEAESL